MLLAHSESLQSPWQWQPHPEVWAIMALVLAGYFLALKFVGPRFVSPGDPSATSREKTLFVGGVLVLWISADWPMHELSEEFLFSAHMLQHFLFSLVAPPLLILGTPGWLARWILRPKFVMSAARRLSRPITALLLFNGYLVFSHWPGFVDFVLGSQAAHFFAHLVLVGLALLMWAPVFSPIHEIPRISAPAQMLYLFGQTIVPTVPASFLTFAEKPFYKAYAEAPRISAGLDAVTDQRIAGVFMKLGGGLLLWAVIAVLFFRWSAREEQGTPDAAEWQDLERQINQARALNR